MLIRGETFWTIKTYYLFVSYYFLFDILELKTTDSFILITVLYKFTEIPNIKLFQYIFQNYITSWYLRDTVLVQSGEFVHFFQNLDTLKPFLIKKLLIMRLRTYVIHCKDGDKKIDIKNKI